MSKVYWISKSGKTVLFEIEADNAGEMVECLWETKDAVSLMACATATLRLNKFLADEYQSLADLAQFMTKEIREAA